MSRCCKQGQFAQFDTIVSEWSPTRTLEGEGSAKGRVAGLTITRRRLHLVPCFRTQLANVKSRSTIFRFTALVLAIALPSSTVAQARAQNENVSSPLRGVSSFVWVPAFVSSKSGEATIQLNTDGLPVSLVILMQTDGSARPFLSVTEIFPGSWAASLHVGA